MSPEFASLARVPHVLASGLARCLGASANEYLTYSKTSYNRETTVSPAEEATESKNVCDFVRHHGECLLASLAELLLEHQLSLDLFKTCFLIG